jgi:hypothetical protein
MTLGKIEFSVLTHILIPNDTLFSSFHLGGRSFLFVSQRIFLRGDISLGSALDEKMGHERLSVHHKKGITIPIRVIS